MTDPQMLDTDGEDGVAADEEEPETIEAADAGHVVSPLDLPTPEEDAKPKRRRARRAAAEEPAVDVAAEPVADAPEFVGEPPKPRRSRRKPADAPVEAAAVDPSTEDGSAAPIDVAIDTEASAPAKPRRRPRRKADAVEADGAADATPAIADAVEESPPPAAADDIGEPADATLATGQDGTLADATADDTDPSEPPRRGWWQRTFGA